MRYSETPSTRSRMQNTYYTISHRLNQCRFIVKGRCHMAAKTSSKWLPPLTLFLLIFLYIVLLIFYSGPARYTFAVSRMLKADTCYIDYLGHKSGSLKIVSYYRDNMCLPMCVQYNHGTDALQ